MTDTQELLAEYVQHRSEPAFRELVSRYVDLVYPTAVRLVDGDTHRAEDVAQIVFTDLSKLASKLSGSTMLGGWLHRHTCFVARTVMRGERRRQARERQAVEMNSLNDPNDSVLARIAPVLDEAIQELGPDDRDAILLRFFERRNLRSVGEALGITENVAGKRVSRAVQELGMLLQRRGVALSAAALASGLAAGAVTAAPAGLALGITGSIFAGSATAGGAGVTTAKVAAMAKLKLGIVGAIVVAGLTTALLLHNQSKATLRQETAVVQPPPAQVEPVEEPTPPPASQEVAPPPPTERPRAPRVQAGQGPRPTPTSITEPPRQPIAMPEKVEVVTPPPTIQHFSARSGSTVRLEGKSNIQDWQAEGYFVGGTLEAGPGFPIEPGQRLEPGPAQAQAEVFIPVRSLKSVDKEGRPYSGKLDELMYESLREQQYPRIFYHLTDLSLTGVTNSNGTLRYEFESYGELAVAGVTNEITMPVVVEPLGNNRVKISGATTVKMTSFQIDPPAPTTALGLIRTRDYVNLLFEWVIAPRGKPTPASQKGLAPLILDLPAPASKGIPKNLNFGPNVEPLSDKPRAPMMVPSGLTNLAPGSRLTSSDKSVPPDALARITDGNKEALDQGIVFLRKGTQWVQMDLGSPQQLFALVIWHAHNMPKVYHNVIVQAADDAEFHKTVRTLFNNDRSNRLGLGRGANREYVETYEGKLINARGIKARYLRFYSRGSTENALNEYTEIEVYGLKAR